MSGQTFGERLLESAGEALRIERGEIDPARAVTLTVADAEVEPPPHYDAAGIRGIREQMGLSQPIFAGALNVSTETIRAWEQGKRAPDGATRRLLEIAEEHPGVFLLKLRPRARTGRLETAGR